MNGPKQLLNWLLLLMLSGNSASSVLAQSTSSSGKQRFAIVLHGGAGGEPEKWSDDYKQRRRAGLAHALDAGTKVLSGGGTALDAVESVVQILEDDPMFNAGRGCVLNERGEHELDASIMDGRTLACGAVAGVKRVKNPISLARHVMTDTRHVLLSANGADQFAESIGMPLMDADYFKTPEQVADWQAWKAKKERQRDQPDQPAQPGADAKKGAFMPPKRYLGTVGCVAVDMHGNIAAGTSTGGLMGKRWGRVGDSPIIGAGTYASNATCGVSCTGTGEEFIRHNVAADMSARLRYTSQSLSEAATTIIDDILPDDCGGLIAIDKNYAIVAHFNTAAMAVAWADSAGQRVVRLVREDWVREEHK
ncbi:MAG: isoaspartyl peptidase/L-asparaginase family protein [Aureliella sp.]